MGHQHRPGDDEARRAERARDVALFRYALIRQAADAALTTRQRGALVRRLAEVEHTGPAGARVRVSRASLDRWIRAWRAGGFDALVPSTRHAEPRTPAAVLELAVALKREVPGRTAVQVAAVLTEHGGMVVPSARTLQRHFARLELNTRPDGSAPRGFGRFEAAAVNERWTGDALHGPVIGGRKTYLMAFLDDHSRALTGYRWGHSEDMLHLAAALRAGLAARGIPKVVYLDNGAAMVSKQLLRALAVLGIRLTHSRPGQPQGRGKIERFFRTVREQFLIELTAPGALENIADLAALNELFAAWVETVYHHRVHSETGQAPLQRFLAAGAPAVPTPAQLREAFLWSEHRLVTKTATVSLHANTYEVDAALIGRRVELVFDPFDLTDIAVRYAGREMGTAVPHQIGRHVHPAARPATEARPAPATGIDYLALVRDRHTAALAQRVNYAAITAPDQTQAAEPEPEVGADEVDAAVAADIASFAAYRDQLPATGTSGGDVALPGQTNLLDLLDPTNEGHADHDTEETP
ncbi:DDE-type integrase/transposase/recombinase [Cellulomonas fimi]|uniref:DDE-type integrase/transposase/recombinase n=1 Tax=Cellulomonas fimi TaxID=1708 RepID=UPI001B85DE4D|nr:DDE-type integrase/transposase/recombinase [Cellulomonas fimi]